MIAIVWDEFSGLAACFDDACALRELMPDAINLDVQEFGWCAHRKLLVRTCPIFLTGRFRDKVVSEFRDKALSRPRAGFAKCADGSARYIIGHAFERISILLCSSAMQHSLGDLLHPKRSFPAWSALAAALVSVEFVDIVQRPDHVARIIHNDNPARSCHRTGHGQSIEINWEFLQAHLLLKHRSVGLPALDLVPVCHAQYLRGTAPRDDRSKLSSRPQPVADVVNQLAKSNAAHLEFIVARPLNISAHAQQPGSRVIWSAHFCVFGSSHTDDVLNVTKGLHVVDDRWAQIQAQNCGKVRWLDPRVGPLAFHRFDESGLFSTNVGASPAVNVDLTIES